MRRLFILVLALSVSLSGLGMIPANAVTENISCSGGGTFTVTDNVVVASSGASCIGVATIPEGATSTGRGVFLYSTGVTGVVFPNSMISIGGVICFGATSLTSVTFGNQVQTIGDNAFYGASKITSIVIPDSVLTIGDSAFQDTALLASVTLGSGLQSIGTQVFAMTPSLTSITIPDNVTTIGGYAFTGSIALASVIIGNGVTSIGERAFAGITALSSITFGSGLTSIGDYAFLGDSSLTSVNFPNSLLSIGTSAFSNNSNLASVTFGSGAISIGNNAFSGAANLTSLTFGNGAMTIGSGAFSSASRLPAINFGSGSTTLGTNAFSGATSVTQIDIPSNVSTIGSGAFTGATNLIKFVISPSHASYSSDAAGVFYNKNKSVLVAYPSASANTSYTIPSSVIAISDNAFKDATRLVDVTIPSSVTSIGYTAFVGSSSLASVRFLGAAPTMSRFREYAFDRIATGAKAYVGSANIAGYGGAGATWNSLTVSQVVEVDEVAVAAAAARAQEIARAAAVELAKTQVINTLIAGEPLTSPQLDGAEIMGSNLNNVKLINNDIALLAPQLHNDLTVIKKIVRKYQIIEILISPSVNLIYSNLLIEINLIPEDYKYKSSVTASLKKTDASDRSNLLEISECVTQSMLILEARQVRLAAANARYGGNLAR
jgi:hypothetical protein